MARKVSEQARTAFFRGEAFKSSNTQVIPQGEVTALVLHQSKIATINHTAGIIAASLCGYPTRVTVERLNAVLPEGFYITLRKGEAVLYERQPGQHVEVVNLSRHESGTRAVMTFKNGFFSKAI